MSDTKVMTGEVRFSYVTVFEPKSINGSTPKYSVSILIRKDDTETIRKIEAAVQAALQEGVSSKFNGKLPPKGQLKLPLRDGDTDRDEEAYAGHYFINANTTNKPGVVDRNVHPILDQSEFYSGCYGRASLNFFAYNTNGNKGVAAGLNNLQKIRDGEPLGSQQSAESEFGAMPLPGTPSADADDLLG